MSDRIVCFDLGGVVVRICRSFSEGCAAADLDLRDPERLADPGLRERRRALSREYQSGRLDCAAYWRGVSDATDGLYTPGEIERIHRAWVLGEYPGVARLIDDLNAKAGVTTACLSNTNHAHWSGLGGAAFPAIASIRRPFVSHEMGAVKPDEDIYRLFESGVGAPPQRILFFDDLPENVEAARALGWDAERIDHEGDTASQIGAHLAARGVA